MNTQDFISQIEKDIKNIICVDFDGVIHENNLGFHDGTIYGNPIDGALDYVKKLSEHKFPHQGTPQVWQQRGQH